MIKSFICRMTGSTGQGVLKRSFCKLSERPLFKSPLQLQTTKSLMKHPSVLRPLGGVMNLHDTKAKGDDELINFLGEEIATEKKGQRAGVLPSQLDGFEIKLNQSEVTFNKRFNNEEISISLNVNHTVDADFAEEVNQKSEKDEAAEMRSRPNFEIDIKKGNQILTFNCSYTQDTDAAEPQQDEYQDAFVIDEISLFEGEWNEQVYAVAGDILDGYLYDLFMNMLEERGITNEFADKLSDFATDYEHKLYVNMLGQLQNFLSKK